MKPKSSNQGTSCSWSFGRFLQQTTCRFNGLIRSVSANTRRSSESHTFFPLSQRSHKASSNREFSLRMSKLRFHPAAAVSWTIVFSSRSTERISLFIPNNWKTFEVFFESFFRFTEHWTFSKLLSIFLRRRKRRETLWIFHWINDIHNMQDNEHIRRRDLLQ